MRFKVGHPSYPQYDFYLLALTPETERQVNRLGPHQIVASRLDWPVLQNNYYYGWADSVNTLWWPRGADQFANCLILLDAARNTLVQNCVAAQVAATPSGEAPRPYLVLSALLAPQEGATAAESYSPAGVAAVSVETELMAWKLYPLPPVQLPAADVTDSYKGLWLLPLVDLRYFWRLGPVGVGVEGSSSSSRAGAATQGFPVISVADTDEATWMPPLRAYPDDVSAPVDYDPIDDNGTHPSITPTTMRGVAADVQAAMQGWRVVCRDVRTNYNATPITGTNHTQFTGIVSDYPDPVNFGSGHHVVATVAVSSPGIGYAVNDLVYPVGGTGVAAVFRVDAVDAAGRVTALAIVSGGDYTSTPAASDTTTTNSAHGTGCTVNMTFAAEGSSSYHADAIRLAGAGSLISGGLIDAATARALLPRKLRVLFQISGESAAYEILTRTLADDPATTADIGEDATGPSTAERLHLPRAVLGVPCPSEEPTAGERAALLVAAEQWSVLYYRWRRRPGFFKFPGIAPVIPNGYAGIISWAFRADDLSTTYAAVNALGETEPIDSVGGTSSSSSATGGFWARLTAKDFDLAPYITYTAVKLADSTSPDAVTWTNEGASVTAYEVNNCDIPIDDNTGASSSSASAQDDPTIVWVRKSEHGDYYLFEITPRWEIVEIGSGGGGRYVGMIKSYDQATGRLFDFEPCAIIDANSLP